MFTLKASSPPRMYPFNPNGSLTGVRSTRCNATGGMGCSDVHVQGEIRELGNQGNHLGSVPT